MNSNLFAARNTPRDFHWAWYLAPLGTIAIALLTAILVMMAGKGPAPTLAATAMPIAAKNTAVGPAPATQPLAGSPAPAPAPGTGIAEQLPTF